MPTLVYLSTCSIVVQQRVSISIRTTRCNCVCFPFIAGIKLRALDMPEKVDPGDFKAVEVLIRDIQTYAKCPQIMPFPLPSAMLFISSPERDRV